MVRVDRWATKSKKQLTYSLEVFHIRKPDIPVDTIEIKGQRYPLEYSSAPCSCSTPLPIALYHSPPFPRQNQ